MSFLLYILFLLMAGVLIPLGIMIGLILGIKLVFYWLDRANQESETSD